VTVALGKQAAVFATVMALALTAAGVALAQNNQPQAPSGLAPQAAPLQQAPAVPQTSSSKQAPAAAAPAEPAAPATAAAPQASTAAPQASAAPQTSAAPQAAASPASSGAGLPPQPPPVDKRGFLNDLGRWWDDSVAGFNDFNKKSAEAAKDAATATGQAMKNAADAMVRWPTSKVVEIHEVCPLAGNGAPDCQAAAANACKTKGFKAGQPLDIRTAESCTASLWVSGQNPPNGECPLESMVLRAACE
jgi:hypothetical protein